MTTLFIFRHGETDWNAEQRFQGHMDIPLNEKGRTQARQLISRLQMDQIEAILSSDLSRAVETAQIVATHLNISVYQSSGLREAHLGLAQGLTVEEIQAKFGQEILTRWRSAHHSDADISYPGGETGKEVLTRVIQSLQSFLEENPKFKTLGVASHGGVIRRMMNHLLPPKSPPVAIPNGVVYEILYDRSQKKFRLPKGSPFSE